MFARFEISPLLSVVLFYKPLSILGSKQIYETKNPIIRTICDKRFKTRISTIEHISKTHEVELGENDTTLKFMKPQLHIKVSKDLLINFNNKTI